MLHLLRAVAVQRPDAELVIAARGTSTYGDVFTDARVIARGLVDRGVSRAAFLATRAEETLALLAAGAMAGVQMCGYPLGESPEELSRLADRFDHDLVVLGADVPDWSDPRAVPIAELRSEAVSDAGRAHAPEDAQAPVPHDASVMILTTGTTGDRRGAVHRWARLAPERPASEPSDARWLLAYNTSQFAGMAVLLQALSSGAAVVQPDALQAATAVSSMRTFAVSHASATPTFWRGVLRELRSDATGLSLRQITLGGEAVPDRLVEELRSVFPDARISQIYAATEFGQSGSVRDGLPGLPESVLHRGDDAPVQLRIVDGELHVRSRTSMVGYYGEPPVDPDAWRPTGDLVEVRDGRVLFLGRASDVVNVGGVKVHPVRVEQVVEQVPGVAATLAYGRKNALTGEIVALEVVLAENADRDIVDDAIREACSVLPQAARPRSIKYVAELTSKGLKLNRRVAGGSQEGGSPS